MSDESYYLITIYWESSLDFRSSAVKIIAIQKR